MNIIQSLYVTILFLTLSDYLETWDGCEREDMGVYHAFTGKIRVIILAGNTEIDAHVKRIFFIRKDLFSCIRAQQVLSCYHLI